MKHNLTLFKSTLETVLSKLGVEQIDDFPSVNKNPMLAKLSELNKKLLEMNLDHDLASLKF